MSGHFCAIKFSDDTDRIQLQSRTTNQ
jgi:hypothetical protein